MKQRVLLAMLCCLLIVAFTGCGDALNSNGEDEGQTEPIDEVFEIGPDDVVMGEYSWVGYYGIETLIGYYDTVVLGTIGEIVAEYNDAAPDVRPRPRTDYSFNVEKVLFDRYGRDIDSQIVIRNNEGTHEGVRWVDPNFPPFVEGERMVIFLKEREVGNRGGYWYHPQGRFIIRDDRVYTIRLRSPRAQLVLKQYHDVPLDQFLDEINAAAEVMKQFAQYRFEAEDVDLSQFVNWQGTSWTFAARIKCSALIVTGTVTEAVNTFDREADNPDKVSPVPFTEYAIIVEEVIFNRYDREIGDSITVQNPGGVLEGTRYIHPYTVPFDEGERVLLFLEETEQAGVYQFHPFGRFYIYDGRVYTDGVKTTRGLLGSYHGMPLDEFLEVIKQELAATEEK